METKRYKVAVTELLRRVVAVEAASEEEAHQRASDAWSNGEIILDGRDFEGTEFHVLGEAGGEELEKIERKGGSNG